jgi:recombination associated protein RdgC
MFFKTIAARRFTERCELTAEDLESALQQRVFRPCGSLDPSSAGFVPPIGKEGTAPLVRVVNGFLMICLQVEEKILPAASVNKIVAERAAEIEENCGTPVRKKERDAIRDEVLQDLLPRAMSKQRRTFAYLDHAAGFLVVDNASDKRADEITGLMRQCLGTLPIVPFGTRERPSALMTAWLNEGSQLPEGLVLGNECDLLSPEADGGTVRFRKHDLSAPEVQNHLNSGKEVVKLELTHAERIRLVLDEGLAVRGLKFLDIVQESAREVETDDPFERFDADMAVMTLELRGLLNQIAAWFGGANA